MYNSFANLFLFSPGYSALMYAAEKGSDPVVRVLLKEGASTDCKVSIPIFVSH